ncbi:MAG: polymer-forming cytoskeletal protein [Acidobacteriota bacterium]
MKKILILNLTVFILILALSATIQASTHKGDRYVTVPKDEIHEGDLLLTGETVTVDGTVTGDLFAFCRSLDINGTVKGDIIAFAQNIAVRGAGEDDVRAFAESVLISGLVKKNVTSFCRNLLVTQEGTIKQNIRFGCEELRLKGKVAGSVSGGADSFTLDGEVGRDARVKGNKITISPTAHIGGDLKATGHLIDISSDAVIEGEIIKGALKGKKESSSWTRRAFSLFFRLIWLLASLIIGVILMKLMPRVSQRIVSQVQQYWKSLGIGFVALIFTPIASLIVAITLIGLPLGLLSLTLYFALLYLSTIFVGMVIGMLILRSFGKPFELSLTAMMVGLLVLHILFFVPYLGFAARIISLILGMGMITLGGFQFLRESA